MTRVICLFAICASAAFLARAEEMKWDDLCGVAHVRALTITTQDVKVRGTCASQTDHGITLSTEGGARTIARDDITSVRLDNLRRSHCLSQVSGFALESFIGGFCVLGTREFFLSPVLIAGGPAILAGGTPYCAVYDLVHLWGGSTKITII
jgi:hypothetical protein